MALVTRGNYITLTDTVQLRAKFRDGDGQLADLDAFPSVTLVQPSGNVAVGPTTTGVYHLATGVYGFDWALGLAPGNLGVWIDVWQGSLNGFTVTGEFNFVVTQGQVPAVNTDGYEKLGDDVPFCYTQCEIHNINKLLKGLRTRLNSSGKVKTKDANGNDIYVDCDIFTVDSLVTMLATSLSMFNQIPTFTLFTFADSCIINQFFEVLVQGATIIGLSAKSLTERGGEYSITDNGINFTPPSVSELLNTQWSAEMTNHTEKVKVIKSSIRPAPLGLGLLSITTAKNPVISQLRHRRARQII